MKQQLEFRIPITDESDNGEVKVKKWKTFEQICPMWSRLIDEDVIPCPKPYYNTAVIATRSFHISLGEPRFCIVGESHNFSSDYFYGGNKHCESCYSFSQYIFYNHNFSVEKIDSFTQHWNEVHNK